jgi:hypothetical protein
LGYPISKFLLLVSKSVAHVHCLQENLK